MEGGDIELISDQLHLLLRIGGEPEAADRERRGRNTREAAADSAVRSGRNRRLRGITAEDDVDEGQSVAAAREVNQGVQFGDAEGVNENMVGSAEPLGANKGENL